LLQARRLTNDPPLPSQVHKLCKESAPKILEHFQPQLMIAIGGGGYVPARILRSFLKQPGSPNIPIQAIGLSLYESLPTDDKVEEAGTKVTRTQWLDLSALGEMNNLVGKKVLIVDEVDDTRTTLEYAVRELEKDVEAARVRLGSNEKTEFSIFVLHVSFWMRLFPLAGLRQATFVLTLCAEQGQAKDGNSAEACDRGGPIPGRAHRRRRLDLLSLGGDRYRRARCPRRRGPAERNAWNEVIRHGNKSRFLD
jgi:uncharacterized protein